MATSSIPTADASTPDSSGGLRYAMAAYGLWGLLPLYLKLLVDIDPFELVGWRILFTVPVCLAIAVALGQVNTIGRVLRRPRLLGTLALSALFITTNWLVYVIAIQTGHIYAASVGYYINPLVNVLLGTIFLRERLGRLQWLAVAVAAFGVAALAWGADTTLIITLILPFSFAIYGLIRKVAHVESLPGLTIETLILSIPACLLVWFAPVGKSGFGDTWQVTLLLVGAGPMTAVPLLLFATAARRMSYSALGFVQFVAPTIVFLTGIFVFHEPLNRPQLICFALIWIAIGLFCTDIVRIRHRYRLAEKRSGSPTA